MIFQKPWRNGFSHIWCPFPWSFWLSHGIFPHLTHQKRDLCGFPRWTPSGNGWAFPCARVPRTSTSGMRSPARCVAKKAAVGWSFWQLSDRWFFSIQYWFFDSSFFWISGIFQYQRFFVFFFRLGDLTVRSADSRGDRWVKPLRTCWEA